MASQHRQGKNNVPLPPQSASHLAKKWIRAESVLPFFIPLPQGPLALGGGAKGRQQAAVAGIWDPQ